MAGLTATLVGRIRRLEQYWYTKNLLSVSLLPVSWLFCVATILRRNLYQLSNRVRPRLPMPVIVVGNISVGGAGKTPLVIWLAELLKSNGYRPGIISRGYGGKVGSCPQWVKRESDPIEVGDEPVLIAMRTGCPTVVAPRRIDAVCALLKRGACDVLISDDGLQHYGLVRDIEIAVIDGDRGLGNGWCLPAGPLRERPARLREVDFVVTHGAPGAGQHTMNLCGERLVNLRSPSIERSLDDFQHRSVHAVAGIGHPARFFNLLTARGLNIHAHVFPDHHHYVPQDLEFGDARPVLMTEKDAVKCRAFAKTQYWYLPVWAVTDARLAQQVLDTLQVRRDAIARMQTRTTETNPHG